MHTDIQKDKRYSAKEVKQIEKEINKVISDGSDESDLNLFFLADAYSHNLYEFVKIIQDPQSQRIINYASKHGSIPSPIRQPKSKIFNAREYDKISEELKNNLERIQYLIHSNVIDKKGNVNDKLDLDYINSIDVKKLEGYVKQQIDFANNVNELDRENQLTPEQANGLFNV